MGRSPEDSEHEVECMRPGVGECIPFPSIWGHWAGGTYTSRDREDETEVFRRSWTKHGGREVA